MINELRNVTENIIVCLSACNNLLNAFKYASQTISHQRFKTEYEAFVYNYELNGYNLRKASANLYFKFDSYEVKIFLDSLRQSEKEGNVLDNLEKFNMVLDLSYSRYLKKQSAKKMLYVTLGTIASLVNIIAIVTYPIFMQVSENLQNIFK